MKTISLFGAKILMTKPEGETYELNLHMLNQFYMDKHRIWLRLKQLKNEYGSYLLQYKFPFMTSWQVCMYVVYVEQVGISTVFYGSLKRRIFPLNDKRVICFLG